MGNVQFKRKGADSHPASDSRQYEKPKRFDGKEFERLIVSGNIRGMEDMLEAMKHELPPHVSLRERLKVCL